MLYEGVIFINKKENEEKAFSYGNAQKWVNMTMKYIYILHAVYKEKAAKCDFLQYIWRPDRYFDV